MNKDDKYYIPDIEDIRYGYQYEELWENIPIEGEKLIQEWVSTIFGQSSDVYEYNRIKQIVAGVHFSFISNDRNLIRRNQIRVPYLTQEQIEDEGWEYNPEFNEYYKKEHAINFLDEWMYISEYIPSGDENKIIFRGECKSINELRYICKLLKI